MAAWQVEQNACNGRGFAPSNPNGYCQKFKEWAVQTYANGGPNWYMHDDQSASGYIVVCDQNAPAPNTVAKYLHLSIPGTAGFVEVRFYLYWNATTHVGRGLFGSYRIPTLDDQEFIYDFRGGPEAMILQSFANNVWDQAGIDEFTDDPVLTETAVNATVTGSHQVNANFQVRGWALNNIANAVDANGWMYVSISLVSGTTYRVDVYKNSARGSGDLVAASAATFTQVVSGNYTHTLIAQNSSGVSGTIYLQGPTTADATIALRVTKVTVGPGEGAQFTAGNDYFIYDFQSAVCVQYIRIASISGDELTLEHPLYRPYSPGAKWGAYPHKFFVWGTSNFYMNRQSNIPYYSVRGTMSGLDTGQAVAEQTNNVESMWQSGEFPPAAQLSTDDNYISCMSPNDKNEWGVQRPGVCEYSSYGLSVNAARNGNRGYGQLKNFIVGAAGSMSVNIHGRILSGINYVRFRDLSSITFSPSSNWAVMLRETESET